MGTATLTKMTRGNQRDLAREKAAKKDKGKSKAANEQAANAGMTKEQRMARDAEIMDRNNRRRQRPQQLEGVGAVVKSEAISPPVIMKKGTERKIIEDWGYCDIRCVKMNRI